MDIALEVWATRVSSLFFRSAPCSLPILKLVSCFTVMVHFDIHTLQFCLHGLHFLDQLS